MLTLHSARSPSATTFLGSHSLLDGNKAGQSAAGAIALRLVLKLSTRLIEMADESQPDQMGAAQIRCLCVPDYFESASIENRRPLGGSYLRIEAVGRLSGLPSFPMGTC